jgi:hypothetical protein
MVATLVHISLLAYLLAAICYLTWLVRLSPALVTAGRTLLLVGLIAHVGAFLSPPHVEAPWRGGQLFSLLAAATVALYLLIDLRSRIPVAGAFVAPLTIAEMVPAHLVHAEAQAKAPLLTHSVILPIHVAASTSRRPRWGAARCWSRSRSRSSTWRARSSSRGSGAGASSRACRRWRWST